VLRPLAERLDETAEDDAAYSQAESDALSAVRGCAPALSAAERAMLTELGSWARGAQDRPDAKFAELRRWLDPIVAPTGESAERVIIFIEYRDTQRWLYERFLTAGYPAQRLALLYGGQDENDREHVKNVFTADPELDDVRVLIATDAAGEGINRQWHCHRVLHWEIPWNPNRLEQRNGRVDRHGQRAPEVQVRHFVPAGWQAATAALPQRLATVSVGIRARIRQGWAEVTEAPDLLGPARQDLIIGELLRYPASHCATVPGRSPSSPASGRMRCRVRPTPGCTFTGAEAGPTEIAMLADAVHCTRVSGDASYASHRIQRVSREASLRHRWRARRPGRNAGLGQADLRH